MSARQLPPRSDLRQLKRQAKDLRRAAAAGVAEALTRIRQHHPRLQDASDDLLTDLSLQDAQLTLARQYGFDSWPRLTAAVDNDGAGDRSPMDTLIGDSLEPVRERLRRAAETGVPVLLCGERGTGKRLATRWLSETAGGAAAQVHCDAMPGTLGEAEIFGYEVGAFTGANASTPGRLEEARGGTLFLHEVGHLSPGAQIRLLEAIDEGSYRRLGSQESRPFDVRLVCTTSTELRPLVERGDLREDLYFRLQVLRIDLPPLRQRLGDIEALARHFAQQAPRAAGEAAPEVAPDGLAALREHDWPGNVRQLRHAVEAAALMCRGGRITAGDLTPKESDGPAGQAA
jgi:DNA-binding NtrC family response regulator